MAPNSFGTAGLRLLQLYVLLSSSGRSYSLTRLAQIFRCSRQTILRMAGQLEMMPRIELESYKQGGERFYQIDNAFSPADIEMDLELLRQLMLCRDIVSHLLPAPIHEEIGEALDNVAGRAKNKDAKSTLTSHSQAFWKGRIDYSPHQTTIQQLYIAIERGRLCDVHYQAKLSEPAREFHVAPLRILAFREALYVRCLKCSAEGVVQNTTPMTLAIHRISKVQIKRITVKTDDVEADTSHFGFWFNEAFKARIRFTPEAATFVSERQWSEGQELKTLPDGGVELTFTSTSRPEVKSWVLSFADAAELLEPADLRQEIHDSLQKTLLAYDA